MRVVNDLPLHGFESICKNKKPPIIVSRDKKQTREHRAYNINENYVTQYRIDGIVLTEGNKCDYLLLNEDKQVAYLIELKGKNLSHAAVQLEETLKALTYELNNYKNIYL